MSVERPQYRRVRAPALAIYAVIDTVSQLEPWQRNDRERVEGQQELIRGTEFVERKLRSQFRDEVQHGFVRGDPWWSSLDLRQPSRAGAVGGSSLSRSALSRRCGHRPVRHPEGAGA